MDPADKALSRADKSGLERDDRLILDHDLLAIERLGQLLLQVVPTHDRRAHRRIEELEARLARGLRLVHRDIRIANEIVGVTAPLPRVGDADAEMDRPPPVAGPHGPAEGLQDARGDVLYIDR